MNSGINLISTKNEDLELKLKRLMIARVVAFVSLLLVALFAAIIFVLTAQIPIASIKKEEATTLNDISYLHAKSAALYLANDRVTNISGIIATRKTYSDIINKIVGLIPSDLSISAFTIESQKIIITLSGTSLFSVDQFINSYIDFGNGGKVVTSVGIDNLVLDPKSGIYTFTITAQLL